MTTESVAVPIHLSTFLAEILKKQAKEGRFDLDSDRNIEVNLTSVVKDPADYLQFKFKIIINQEGRDALDLFAKVTSVKSLIRDKLMLKPFEKERLFYTSLMTTYRQLEDKHGLLEQDRLRLSTCYGAEAAHENEILVLENLTCRGFNSARRFESASWPYAAAAVTELAKFHALSLAFQHENPTEFETFITQIHGGLFENNEHTKIMSQLFISLALNAVGFGARENKKKLNDFFKNKDFVTTFNNLLKPLKLKVILHGHFWPKNTMHKVLTDGVVEVILLDYSTIQVGSIVTDLIHFVFTATDASFRETHFDELIRHYYLELKRATAKFGLDLGQIYTWGDMKEELIEKLPFGLFAALAYLFMLAHDTRADRAQGLLVDEETYRADALQMYYQRINEVVDAFVGAGILQDQDDRSTSCCGTCFI